jgi:SAM-dependent methyltransferase
MSSFDAGAFSRFEHNGWQRKAHGYHEMYAPLSGYVIELLLDAVDARTGQRLLDLGTGPGYVAAAAIRRGCETVGMDFAPAMVDLARSLHPACTFEVGDAEALPFGDATFDCVTGNFVLHHVPRQQLALQEAARVLVPGGRLALTAWSAPDRNRFLGLFVDALQESGASLPPDVPSGPPMAADDDAYRGQLTEAGFEELFVEHVQWSHRFANRGLLWDGLLAASVRTATLIELQPESVRRLIRREFDRLVASYETKGGLDVPVAATLFGGRLPVS